MCLPLDDDQRTDVIKSSRFGLEEVGLSDIDRRVRSTGHHDLVVVYEGGCLTNLSLSAGHVVREHSI